VTDPRVTGRLRYPQDAELDGMWHARILRSTQPSARVIDIDVSAVGDDVVVLRPEDVANLGVYGCQIKDQRVVTDVARYIGDPIAAIAAPTREEATRAMESVLVNYEELPAVFDERDAASPGAPLLHERHAISDSDAAYFGMRPIEGTNICHRFRIRQGDADRGLETADVVMDETFRIAGAQQAPMEPHAAVAHWNGDRLEVITGSQTPFNTRMDLAGIFGIAEEHIRVVCPPMGGAFGAKTFVRLEAVVAALARKVGRPVKAVLDRAEEWLTVNRHPATIKIRLGATRAGRFVAKRVECWANTGAYADCGPGVAQKMGYAAVGPYRIDQVWVDSHAVYTNLPPNGAFRGYGATQAVWASERATDLMAERLGIDPFELRLRNLLTDGDRFCTGEVMHDVRFAELLREAADAVKWSQGRSGKGLCVMLKGMQTPSRASVEVHRRPGERYLVRCATTEMGQGSTRAIQLMAAELLGVDSEKVSVPPPDTEVTPYDTRTTSSRSTHMMGRALVEAVKDLRRRGDVGCGEISNSGGLDPDTGQGVASSHWHQGAAAAEVEVDDETGRIVLHRVHASIYAGRVVNRAGAELQNEGSMIMGLGTALFEGIDFAAGQVTNANLSDYNLPAAADVTSISHTLVEHEGAEVHGVGETALPPVPAAVGNALGSLGINVTDLPMTPERVLEAIDSGATASTHEEVRAR
jgi:CO/xanthine dehydrogenase Mo-binding subunit